MVTKFRMAMASTLTLAVVGLVAGIYFGMGNQVQAAVQMPSGSDSDIYRMSDTSPVAGVASNLVRTENSISATLQTSELEAGHAYTIWWVIFNNPGECQAPIGAVTTCGEADVFAEPLGESPVQVSVQYAGGNVIGGTGLGNFGATLSEGEIPQGKGQLVFGPGLIDAGKAEVHLVVRDHGPVAAGFEMAQITTFGGACTADTDPTGIGPLGINTCADVQFAAHLP